MLILERTYKISALFLCLFASSFKVVGQHRKGKKVLPSKEPKFIENIYLDGHTRTKATVNAIESRKKNNNEVPTKVVVPEAPTLPLENRYTTQDIIPATDKKSNVAIDLSLGSQVYEKYAKIIGVSSNELSNLILYKFVDKWYGTNYRLGGFSEQGVDCSGFTKMLYQEVYGKELARTSVEQHKNANREKIYDNAKEGDLVFFRQRSKRINHVGVYLGNNYFIHASTSHGVMISSLTEVHWQKSFAGIGKLSDELGQ
jgi:cell wall-associated NlpC family hydrolase